METKIVTGIGFIGAGTIILHRQLVRGLTTAASLWATAGIGLAAGAHLYVLAGVATLLTLFGLEALSLFFGPMGRRRLVLVLSSENRKALDRALAALPINDFSLLSYEVETLHEMQTPTFRATMVLRTRKATATDHYIAMLRADSEILIEQIL